jgi:hypothetical protein
MARVHKDVEFAVDDFQDNERIFKDFEEAAGFAVTKALSSGRLVELDVLVHSRAGAKALEGDDGVERYDEDPEASVFERIVVRADSQGRVR